MKFPNKTTLEAFAHIDLEDAVFWELLVKGVDKFMALEIFELDQI